MLIYIQHLVAIYFLWIAFLLPCDAMQVRPMRSCGVCVSVVHFVKTNKHILKFFSLLGI